MTAEAELKKFHIFKYYICAFHVYATYVDDKVQNLIETMRWELKSTSKP